MCPLDEGSGNFCISEFNLLTRASGLGFHRTFCLCFLTSAVERLVLRLYVETVFFFWSAACLSRDRAELYPCLIMCSAVK